MTEQYSDLLGLECLIDKMQNTLRTYEILLEEERTRIEIKGNPPVTPGYYEGCISTLQSLLYFSADLKARNDSSRANELRKNQGD